MSTMIISIGLKLGLFLMITQTCVFPLAGQDFEEGRRSLTCSTNTCFIVFAPCVLCALSNIMT